MCGCCNWIRVSDPRRLVRKIHVGIRISDFILRFGVTNSTMVLVPQNPRLSLQWRHYEQDGVSNNQRHHCLLSRLFGCRSKKTSKLRVTGLCAGNSPWTGEFPAQMASNAENVSIWWRHHAGVLAACSGCRGSYSTIFFVFCCRPFEDAVVFWNSCVISLL